MERPQPEDPGSCLPATPSGGSRVTASDVMSEAPGSSLHFALTEVMSKMATCSQPLLRVCESGERMDMKAPCPL